MITRVETTPASLPTNEGETGAITPTQAAAAMNAMMRSSGISLQAEGDSNLKPPDYHLPFTGDQTVEALWKIINLDLKKTGGITIVESSAEAPANLDTITTNGNYLIDYVTAATFPDEFVGKTPFNVNVSTQTDADGNNTMIQVIESGGNKYYRWTRDGGTTWSTFAPKSTNSGPIDPEAKPEDPPPKDPVTVLEERADETDKKITEMEKTLANSLRLGTEAMGTQIMNGTFDYDTVTKA